MLDIDGAFTYSKILSVRLSDLALAALTVYPNPATDLITIKLAQSIHSKSILKVTDAIGRTVIEKNIATSQNSIPLNVQHLAAGKYFIMVQNGGEFIRQSFIKTK